jgi:hypothetical protein
MEAPDYWFDLAPPHLPQAACRQPGVDPLWFFPERGHHPDLAFAVCRSCPEREPCRAWALEHGSQHLWGVWGGTTWLQRRHLRAELRHPA